MKCEKVYRADLGAYRWKIDLTIRGKRIRRADFESRQEAIEAAGALLSEARALRYGLIAPKPTTTLKELYKRISQTSEMKARPRALEIFDSFVDLIGSDFKLADLSQSDWQVFVESCKACALKPASINRYLTAISGILRRAPRYFPALSDWAPPKAPWESRPLGRDRVLSVKEVNALLAGFRAERQPGEWDRGVKWRHEVLDLFRLMLLTGAREGELLNLRHAQISWDWQTVQIESRKGGPHRRIIPLSKTALNILSARQENAPAVFKPLSKTILYNTLRKVGTIAKVPHGENVAGGWVIYDLRHLAATVMENAGVPYSAVSALLGHKRRDQTATYTHAQLSTMRKGVESLESWCREIDGFNHEFSEIACDLVITSDAVFG